MKAVYAIDAPELSWWATATAKESTFSFCVILSEGEPSVVENSTIASFGGGSGLVMMTY